MDFKHYLSELFNPKTIAVVGASQRTESLGHLMWNNLKIPTQKAKLYAVTPKYKRIGEDSTYASVTAIRGSIDLVIVVSPPSTFETVLEECAKKKVGAVLLCGGHSKTEINDKILKAIDNCTKQGILVAGPQSLGIVSTSNSLNASYLPQIPKAGNVGLISQSPGVACSVIEYVADSKCGFSYIVDAGLEYALNTADYVDMLAHDNSTECIVLYLESFKAPRRLLSAIRYATKTKPVLLLKGGRTAASADIVINNNSARQDEDGVMEQALIRAGALLVNSLRELSYAIQVFSSHKRILNSELWGIVNSKGLDTLMADLAYKHNITFVEPTTKIADELSEKFKILHSFADPLNTGLDMSPKELASLLELLLSKQECGGILISFAANPQIDSIEIAKAIVPVIKKTEKLVVTTWIGDEYSKPAISFLKRAGIPALCDLNGACVCIEKLMNYYQLKRSMLNFDGSSLNFSHLDLSGARKIVEKAQKEGRNLLYENDTKRLLSSIGFEASLGVYAGSIGEAIESTKLIGYPVALKIRSDGVLSKEENSFVYLGIRNEKELRQAWKAMEEQARELHIPQDNFGAVLQNTYGRENQRELRLGFRHTKNFGPIVFISVGGFYGQLLVKPKFNFVPLSEQQAKQLLNSPEIDKLLGAYKGLPEVNKSLICEALLKLSELAVNIPSLRHLEIDPLLCGPKHAIVLDAFAFVDNGPLESDDRASHLIFPHQLNSETSVKTKGGELTIRPAQLGDQIAYAEYLNSLSDRTKTLRFHSNSASHESIVIDALAYDPDRSYSIVALDSQNDNPQIVAEARFSLLPNAKDAEFGISVRDDWQRKGLSKPLMVALESEARNRKIQSLIGYVLNDNSAMSAMMEKRGYKARVDENDPGVLLFELRL